MTEATPVDLAVVVPAFNEEDRLGPTLERIVDYLEARPGSWEVLVVDDGSRDRTAAVAGGFAGRGVRTLRLGANRGKGAAVRHGVLASRGARVLISDADLSTPIEDLERLEARAAEAPLVFGSRAAGGARITRRQPLFRELMGKTFNLLLRSLRLVELRDTQCGFKLLDGAVARPLFADLRVDGFAWDVELARAARRAGHRVVEVGVTWHNSPRSTVHPVSDSLRMFRDVLRLRLRRR